MERNNIGGFASFLQGEPQGWARIKGSDDYPQIDGAVSFYATPRGVIVQTHMRGLPMPKNDCDSPILAIHIHSGGSCTGNEDDPFANAGIHYDTSGCPHPYHAGDMLPLFSAGGYAYSVFLTDRFNVDEVIGKTVIVHASPDDFMTQPSGNAGEKIACGVIQR